MSDGKKILLVSKEPPLIEKQCEILNNRDIRILSTSSDKEALDIHRRENVDLVICSIEMSQESLSSFCRQMKGNGKNPSIIMTVRSGSVRDIENLLNSGADDYLCEPFEPVDLLQKAAKSIDIVTRSDKRVYVKLKIEGKFTEGGFVGFTIDLSLSGFLMETDHRFLIGESADFSLIDFESGKTISVRGKIVRKSVGRFPNIYLYGVRFFNLDSEERRFLETCVAQKT